jgi:membrane peptidoglycan carboxypeptidase
VTDPDGKVVFESRPQQVRQAMDPGVARTLRSFMREVMVTGTGAAANVEWVEIGGKTGTSEKLVEGQYSGRRHYASFLGIAPLEDPRIVCYIVLDEPQGATFGGSAAAPVFRRVLEAFGRLPGASVAPKYERMLVQEGPARRDIVGLWTGARDAAAGPHDGPGLLAPEKGLPDLRGVPLRRALQALAGYGVGVEIRGTGVVREQDPLPGSASEGTVVLTGDREGATTVMAANHTAGKEETPGPRSTGPSGSR